MPTLSDHYSAKEQTTRYNLPTPTKFGDLLYYATAAGHEYITKGYYLERRGIDLYMINYIVKGGMHAVLDGKHVLLTAGDLCFLNLEAHSILYPADDEPEIYFFHILGGQIQKVYEYFVSEGGNVLHGVSPDLVGNLYDGVVEIIGRDDFFYSSSKLLGNFLTDLMQLASAEKQKRYPPLIEEIIRAIRNLERGNVTELAKKFGYSPIYLERLFKRYTGSTLREQVMYYKYDIACNMLLHTDLSVEEIARKVGYADIKGLLFLFKKMGGSTPNTFRKTKSSKWGGKKEIR